MVLMVNAVFTETEKTNLWSALDTQMKKTHLMKEWQELKKKGQREGKVAAKNRVLALQLSGNNLMEWQSMVAKEINDVIHNEKTTSETEWKYRGELDQMMGEKQAQEFIDKNKFLVKEDADGDLMYRRVRHVEIVEDENKKIGRTEGSKDIDAEVYEQLQDAMAQQKIKLAGGIFIAVLAYIVIYIYIYICIYVYVYLYRYIHTCIYIYI